MPGGGTSTDSTTSGLADWERAPVPFWIRRVVDNMASMIGKALQRSPETAPKPPGPDSTGVDK